MKKWLVISLFVFSGCSVMMPLQRSKFIAVFHLIETSNYDEAKDVIEQMIADEESSQWARTWYARGVLSQTAYQDGMRRNDRRRFELYPDQLYVVYESFEKAMELDSRGRFERQLMPKYVSLANDFQRLGEREFNAQKYDEALRAFEHALQITQSELLAMRSDTSLLYNAALAAYEGQKKQKALEYLSRLDEYQYSTNVPHLLFTLHMEKGDTLAAEKVLLDGMDRYKDNEDLVLLLADLLYHRDEPNRALRILDRAAGRDPENYKFPYTQGLILQKMQQFSRAIGAYEKAVLLAPDQLMIYASIATCYYNIGVEIEENSRRISNNRLVLEERARSEAAFESATSWLDRAYEKQTGDAELNQRLYQLYRALNINDKARSLQSQIN